MPRHPGLVGGSAHVRSSNVNAEQTVNWYPEVPPGTPKVPMWLVPTPGLAPFTVLSAGPVRAIFAQDGRAFAVGGGVFYELFVSGNAAIRGGVAVDGRPATISSNGTNGGQLFITSGGFGYIYSLTADTLTQITAEGFPLPVAMGAFSDGYFLALKDKSNQFNISTLYDGLEWDALDVYLTSITSDESKALVESHRDIWILGSQTTGIWSNTGDADTPYQPVTNVKIDMGCAAPFSAIRIDNTIFWLGQSEGGANVVWRANGYTPQRISDHGVEFALSHARRVDDAIAWAYQEEGHTFYVLYVPDLANVRGWGTTWVYDVATGLWHERALWDSVAMEWQPHLGRCHAFGFGRHLVGDRTSPAIYTMRLGLATDGQVIVGLVPTFAQPVTDYASAELEDAIVVPYGEDVTIGNLLVAMGAFYAWDATRPTITDSQGNVWTLRVYSGDTLGPTTYGYFSATAVAGVSGPCTVTITPDEESYYSLCLREIVHAGAIATSYIDHFDEAAIASFNAGLTAAQPSGTMVLGGWTTAVAPSPEPDASAPFIQDVEFDLTNVEFQAFSGTYYRTTASMVANPTWTITPDSWGAAQALAVRPGRLTPIPTTTPPATPPVYEPPIVVPPPDPGPDPPPDPEVVVPTLVSVTPNTADQGDTVSVTLIGTGFVIGATTVTVSGTGITVSAVVVSSTTSLTATLTLTGGATLGSRSVRAVTADGTSGSKSFVVTDPAAVPGDRDLLVASDLTLAGQQNLDHNYNNLALALRYVAGQRRFLIYNHDGTDGGGDLIEYKENVAGLKNGGSHWVLGNVPNMTEVRRWKNWSTRGRIVAGAYPAIFAGDAGNGAWPSSFHWDEGEGCMWYTFQPVYPGGGTTWPAYSAVYLDDAEAVVVGDGATVGRTVSTDNIKGPFYFKDAASSTAWKTASSGLLPIPTERQAAMGASFLNAGHHAANIGTDGPRSLSFWKHGNLPTPGVPNATILTDAVHIYDTGSASGATPPQMRMPNIQYQAGMHASPGTAWTDAAGVQAGIGGGGALPLNANSFLYQHEYGNADCVTVFMNTTAAAGGAWVPEVYTGSGWIVPTGWALAAGNQQLSALENVFYWPKVTLVDVAPITGGDLGKWVRLRQTGTGTNAGSFKAMIFTESALTSSSYPDRPGDPDGTYEMLGSEEYDADHYSTCYEEMLWGGAWVRTDNVEGIAYFGPLKCGAQWYGGAPAWFQPVGGGTPVKHYYYYTAESFSNGGKSEGPMYPFFFTFDHEKVIECAAGTRDRNADGLQPEAFWRMPAEWSEIIYYGGVNVAGSPYYPSPSYATYGNGTSVVWDPIAQQLIVWLTNGAVFNGYGIFAFFDVR